jgi:hypothetical protein
MARAKAPAARPTTGPFDIAAPVNGGGVEEVVDDGVGTGVWLGLDVGAGVYGGGTTTEVGLGGGTGV